jgi:YVTN family beta-propeller protein
MREEMSRLPHLLGWLVGICVVGALGCSSGGSEGGGAGGSRGPETLPEAPILEPASGHPGFASPQVQSIALSPTGLELYVANTAADTLDIIDTETREIVYRVATGIDPVSAAVRPDGLEVWVSNHVSDSVSVIDVDPSSPTRYRVVGTIQAWDGAGLVTDFDEPTSIAFAGNAKGYVSLSSRNRIAVVDVASRTVTNQIQVFAQEPRALTVRDGRLYVLPFESGNQTELSGCLNMDTGSEDCTFELIPVLLANSNDAILTRNFPANIIRNPKQPDRDLFVYETENDTLVEEVTSIGTLLYGLAVDSERRVFIAQTEARNDANGLSADGDDLIDLENRAFLNQIARVDCASDCVGPTVIELEPELPEQPAEGMALATPFGIQISGDDSTLVAVAAGSSRLFTMNAATGEVLGRVQVGAIPRSLVLESDAEGAPLRAWVLNGVEDSISLVDVSDPSDPSELTRITLEDPTLPNVKRGRIAFNDAEGSTSGTYSCESCHPDGNTDQLLWNLGAICLTEGCDQTIPRTTMPIRGLRDTLPLHWDGVPGNANLTTNGEVADSGEPVDPNCTDEHSCFRDLVNGSMSGTMCDVNACPTDQNESGLAGAFDEGARDAMADFLKSVPYPPARSRRLDDRMSDLAFEGFHVFLIGDDDQHPGCSRAGGCHAAPKWAGFAPGTGMQAPTFRGLSDRHLLLPNGRAGMWDLLDGQSLGFPVNEVDWDPSNGPDELFSWGLTFGTESLPLANRNSTGRGPFEIFQLFEETSTGFSGAFARQVTLDASATSGDQAARTDALLDLLEAADRDGQVDLRGNGASLSDGTQLVFVHDDGVYYRVDRDGVTSESLTRTEIIEQARSGAITITLTARLGVNSDVEHPQPVIFLDRSTIGEEAGCLEGQSSPFCSFLPGIPVLTDEPTITLRGGYIVDGTIVLVDGSAVGASVSCAEGGALPDCENLGLRIDLDEMPPPGDHTFQLVTPDGMTSNDLLLTAR